MVRVSVVLPLNRIDEFTLPAVQSVLDSRGVDLELIIVFDQLPMGEIQVLKTRLVDKRIVFLTSEGAGIVPALNKGVEAASSDFIARMDGDDLCHPDRLARQVDYLVRHKEVLVVGCNINFICKHGVKTGSSRFSRHVPRSYLLRPFSSPVAHPAAMIRSSVFRDGVSYRELFDGFQAEDFDLWYQVLRRGAIHNLCGSYLQYRVHSGQVSTIKARQVALSTVAVVLLDLYHPLELGSDHSLLHSVDSESFLSNLISPSQVKSLSLAKKLRLDFYFGYLAALELLQDLRVIILPRTKNRKRSRTSFDAVRKHSLAWSLILLGPVAFLHLRHALLLALGSINQCRECKSVDTWNG